MQLLTGIDEYPKVLAGLERLSEAERTAHLRNLCRLDLYFLLRYGMNRLDMEHPWLFARCREVRANPNGFLDLWAREHRKTSIIAVGMTIFDILNDPEVTVGIFSHTRPLAKSVLRMIKTEFEKNNILRKLFPDNLWENPAKEAPKWSEDDGIIVKRRSNPREATVEAWGLVDGPPIGKHFKLRVYDDVVTESSVGTPEMIEKTTRAFENSDNLGAIGGTFRICGTRYHYLDTYSEIERRGIARVRLHPCTLDGSENFDDEANCAYMPGDLLKQKRHAQGAWVFSCQMMLRPQGDEAGNFRREWIQKCTAERDLNTANLNIYAFCDPANSKSKSADFTAIAIIGLGVGKHYVVLDVVRDQMNLQERTEMVWELHRKWRPRIWFYEQYGAQADRQHIEYTKHERNDRTLRIEEVGGKISKNDRVRALLPLFEAQRITLPPSRWRTLHDGRHIDVIDALIQEELLLFPRAPHDDLIDAIARVLDPDIQTFLRFPDSDAEAAQRRTGQQISYNGNTAAMSPWQRHQNKMAGRGGRGSGTQRPVRPQERGIWAGNGNWK